VKKTAAKGHARKHTGTAKHAKHHAKHHPTAHQLHMAHMQHLGLVTAKAKPATHAKARALALDGTGCCVSEALAASLRLYGVPVGLDDVLGLHRAADADDDHGVPVRVLLEAAAEYGLAGYRPVGYRPAECDGDLPGRSREWRHPLLEGMGGEAVTDDLGHHLLPYRAPELEVAAPGAVADRIWLPLGRRGQLDLTSAVRVDEFLVGHRGGDFTLRHALILGIDLPGPHAVLAAADGWWSWGELHCPCEWPDAVIEEAWALTWQVTP
jgi:hypothetical protein